MKLSYSIFIFFIFLFGNIQTSFSSETLTAEKIYTKEYFSNGNIKAEGWSIMDAKTEYWTFYHENGNVSSKGHFVNNERNGYWHFYNESEQLLKEGHFENDSAENWWIFYDIVTQNKSKFQFKNNQKNGFALRYKKKKLVKAEEYKNGKKIDEWTSLIAFKLDNPSVSLR